MSVILLTMILLVSHPEREYSRCHAIGLDNDKKYMDDYDIEANYRDYKECVNDVNKYLGYNRVGTAN